MGKEFPAGGEEPGVAVTSMGFAEDGRLHVRLRVADWAEIEEDGWYLDLAGRAPSRTPPGKRGVSPGRGYGLSPLSLSVRCGL